MEVEYKNKKIEKICKDGKTAQKKLGKRSAELLAKWIDVLRAAPTLSSVYKLPKNENGRLHAYHNKDREFSMDLVHPYRMIFSPIDCDTPEDYKTVTSVIITKVKHDPH